MLDKFKKIMRHSDRPKGVEESHKISRFRFAPLEMTLAIFLILTVFSLPVSARVLQLSTLEDQQFNRAEVYKPSKLVIGTKTSFVVKADPGSHAAIILAANEDGSQPLARVDGVVGEKGVTELAVELPDDKELVNKVMYFEVAVWKNEDFSDAKKARIVATDGINTGSNSIIITGKPKSGFMPGFGPAMPGVGDVSRTMDAVQQDINLDDNSYYYNKPLILRNLRAPELKEEDGQ